MKTLLCFSSLPAQEYGALVQGLADTGHQIAGIVCRKSTGLQWSQGTDRTYYWREAFLSRRPWADRLPLELLDSMSARELAATLPMVERWPEFESGSMFSMTRWCRAMSYALQIMDQTQPGLLLFLNVPLHPLEYFLYRIAVDRGIAVLIARHGIVPGSWCVVRRIDAELLDEHWRPGRWTVPLNTELDATDGPSADAARWLDAIKPTQDVYLPDYMKQQGVKAREVGGRRTLGMPSLLSQVIRPRRFFYLRSLRMHYQCIAADEPKIAWGRKNIFVPLHYQPEATTMPLGDVYVNQALMLKRLSDVVDRDTRILVKEHATTFFPKTKTNPNFRTRFDYDLMAQIPKVQLVSVSIPAGSLLDRVDAVATITGTAGLEAVARGKTVFVFGLASYRNGPNVFDGADDATLARGVEAMERRDAAGAEKLAAFIACSERVSLSSGEVARTMEERIRRGKATRVAAVLKALTLYRNEAAQSAY